MEKTKNAQSVYTEPELKIIHLTGKDIITTSGFRDDETELIPFNSWS